MKMFLQKGKKSTNRILAALLAAVLTFGLFGCGAEMTSTGSRAEVPSYSDSVLDLMSNPAPLRTHGSVRGQAKIDDIAVFSFFSKYADSMTTQNMYRYDDICADTPVNAKMVEFIRCRTAFLRLTGEYRSEYSVAVTAYTRSDNGDATVTIGVSATERYYSQGRGTILDQSEWKFVLGKDGEKNIIQSAQLLSRPADYIYDNLEEAFAATGLPLETPEQIHAAGDEVIRQLYASQILPRQNSQKFGSYLTAPLPYTDEYVLIYTLPPYTFEYGKSTVGLADKNGNIIFNVYYKGIAVTENGYFVLYDGESFLIVGPDGNEVGRYYDLSCYTVYENGIESSYEAASRNERSTAPYAAVKLLADGRERFWLLDENFQPIGEWYDSLILFGEGANATKDGSYYNLDRAGNVIEKKEAGVFKTFFGKYQLTIWYDSWYNGDVIYGLTDLDGNIIYEQKYCKIEMPFEDRVVLYTGNNQSYDERAAALADAKGNIINTQYNVIIYLVTKDGYIGIARSFGEHSMIEVGCKEAGYWLVDKDGNPVSGKYKDIGNYINDLDGWLYINTEDIVSPLMFQNEDGTIKTVPLEEVLIKLH